MGKRRALRDSSDFEEDFLDADWTESTKQGSRQGTTRHGKRLKKEEDTLRGSNGVQHAVSHTCNLHVISSPQECRIALLRWYSGVETARGMPWRKPYDPNLGHNEKAQRAYEVWVSEVMLQQTQVATVIPFYNRWMEKFPTLPTLAASSIEDVNALWKGLGYYSRASRLLEGAQKAVRDYDGNLPENAKEMEANIPGIGRYSAGAICSIAYGERVPVLDGNVHRLLSRFLALHAPPKAKATLDILWQAATDMVKKQLEPTKIPPQSASENVSNKGNYQHPGDINQALIELGSTICKVRDPQCESCPLQPWCSGYSLSSGRNPAQQQDADIEEICSVCIDVPLGGDVTIYPMKVIRKKAREELDVVNVIEWRSAAKPQDRWFLVVRRPDDGLLAGLYDFPTMENVSHSVSASMLEKVPSELLAKFLQTGISSRTRPSKVADHPSDSSSLNDEVTGCTLRIAKVEPMGDILHIFSHIKKTYRVQWVAVEGGDELPELRAGEKQIIKNKMLTSRTKKVKSKSTAKIAATEVAPSSQWVRLEEVAKLNIGTGVAKVWDLVRKHWMQDFRNQGEV